MFLLVPHRAAAAEEPVSTSPRHRELRKRTNSAPTPAPHRTPTLVPPPLHLHIYIYVYTTMVQPAGSTLLSMRMTEVAAEERRRADSRRRSAENAEPSEAVAAVAVYATEAPWQPATTPDGAMKRRVLERQPLADRICMYGDDFGSIAAQAAAQADRALSEAAEHVAASLPSELTAIDEEELPEADNRPSGAVLRALALAGTSLGPQFNDGGFGFPTLDEGTASLLAGMFAERSEQAVPAAPASAASGAEWAALSQNPEVTETLLAKAAGDALGLNLQASVLSAGMRNLINLLASPQARELGKMIAKVQHFAGKAHPTFHHAGHGSREGRPLASL